ncbi:MAG: M1 family peptidase, partial [Bacteroidia bacterium]|nr:M1 family peptidase [Bacteroidia bacterium]
MRLFYLILLLIPHLGYGQGDRWQQHVVYDMEIDVDVEHYKLFGKQKIKYTNNSPDTLRSVFYHLYFNAFQPGSMMDVRSRTVKDPDPRVIDRISKLKEDEIGYQKVLSLKQDGQILNYNTEGTILEVDLGKPLLPGKSTKLEMEFESQVPLQIRRSGRDNKEGIS